MVDHAQNGDRILFAADLPKKGPIALTQGEIAINKDLTFDVLGKNQTMTISAGHKSRIFNIGSSAHVTLNDLAITDGTASSILLDNLGFPDSIGDGIYSAGTLTLRNCTLSHNFENRVFDNTPFPGPYQAYSVGTAIYDTGVLTLQGCTEQFNSGTWYSDGTWYSSISLSTIVSGESLMVDHSTLEGLISASEATIDHSGFDYLSAGGPIIITNSSFGNAWTSGGGMVSNSTGGRLDNIGSHDMIVSACTLAGAYNSGTMTLTSSAVQNGNGIVNDQGSLDLIACSITGNYSAFGPYAGFGGGIKNIYGTVVMNGCIVSGNTAYDGGGIANVYGTVVMNGCTVSGNTAFFSGGIANDYGTVVMNGCTVSGNTASYGGGLENVYGTVVMNGCTVSGNTASYGGGIYNSGGSVYLYSSTVSLNTADYGGGVYNDHGLLTLYSSTITNNTATYLGGGIYSFFGTLYIDSFSSVTGNGQGSGSDIVSLP